MTDTRNRFYKAKRRARDVLAASGLQVRSLAGDPFDLEASQSYVIRKIKICLDSITKDDRSAVDRIIVPGLCRKEIWLKKSDAPGFQIVEL